MKTYVLGLAAMGPIDFVIPLLEKSPINWSPKINFSKFIVSAQNFAIPDKTPPYIAKERKVKLLLSTAHKALVIDSKADSAKIGVVVGTQFDGRPNIFSTSDGKLRYIDDLVPTEILLNVIPNVAVNCISIILGLKYPSVTFCSRSNLLGQAINIAEGFMNLPRINAMLTGCFDRETDWKGCQPTPEYAVFVLLSKEAPSKFRLNKLGVVCHE